MISQLTDFIKKIDSKKTSIAGIAAGASDFGNALNIAAVAFDSVAKGVVAVSPEHAGIAAILICIRALATCLIGWFAKDKGTTVQ